MDVERVVAVFNGAGVNDSEEKGLRVHLRRCCRRDRIDVDNEDLAELAPERLQNKIGRTIAVSCIPINSELILVRKYMSVG